MRRIPKAGDVWHDFDDQRIKVEVLGVETFSGEEHVRFRRCDPHRSGDTVFVTPLVEFRADWAAPQPAPTHARECDKPGCLVVHAPVAPAPAAGDALKPCPFCGAEARVLKNDGASCSNRECIGSGCAGPRDSWNLRPSASNATMAPAPTPQWKPHP